MGPAGYLYLNLRVTGSSCSGFSCSRTGKASRNFETWIAQQANGRSGCSGQAAKLCWRFWDVKGSDLQKLLCQNASRAASGSGLAASTIKIQKLISFSRSPNEHFSLKPCKVILFVCMDLPVASHHVASLV